MNYLIKLFNKDNKYDYGLKGKVIYIGLAHHGKDVSIKWVES